MSQPEPLYHVIHDEEQNHFTTIRADAVSVDFSTTDREGNEQEPSFELTWPQIFAACREYLK